MHKFDVGQPVQFRRNLRPWQQGTFTVLRVLAGGSVPEYRIKSADEPYERIASEGELQSIRTAHIRPAA
jgi:hypothetical protein